MVFSKGIKQRTISVFLIIFLCIILTSVGLSIYRGFSLTGKILGERSLQAASNALKAVDKQKLETIIKNMDENSSEYIAMQEKLSLYREMLNIKYLYTMTKNEKGQYIYVVDGTDRNSESFSKIGSVETQKNYYKTFDKVLNGEVVINSLTMDSEWGNLVSAYIPIKDAQGKVIAFIGADIDAQEMFALMKSNIITTILCIFIIFLIGVIAIWFFSNKLTNPIIRLRDYSLKVLNGEAVMPFEQTLEDEVGQLANVLNNRIGAIRNILNNTGEGLLTVGSDLIVDREYSYECSKIFNKSRIDNQNVAELIFSDNTDERNFMDKSLRKIFQEKSSIRRAAYLSLLVNEAIINERSIKIKYKVIKDTVTKKEIIMLILKDITEKRQLESKIEHEKNTLDSTVKIMVNFDEFSSLVNDYYVFASVEIWEMLHSKKTLEEIVYEIYGKIHTFKGDFSIFGKSDTTKMLHEFEQEISSLQKGLIRLDVEKLIEYFKTKNLHTWMDKDLESLSQIAGLQFVDGIVANDRVLVIENCQIDKLEKFVDENLSEKDRKTMISQIEKLRFKPFNSMMKLYPDYIEQLAIRLDKEINLVKIVGGDFLVDTKKYKNFVSSLIHIFRNSIDHGIEDTEERISNNKSGLGSITCHIELKDKQITIDISDDGKGIDIEKIKETSIEKHIKSKEELEKMSEEELINLIFIEEFSTRKNPNELSGRGIGLPSFMNELQKLNGSVRLITKAGTGTSFIITIPNVESEDDNI